MFNKRDPLWLVPIAFVVTGVACWMLLRDVFPGTIFRKPVCASTAPSTGDCVPQRLLDKLPPHPGRSGTDTLAGVDADGDGVRDDVQRFIVENYGYSERGVRALNNLARSYQMQILTGDSASQEQVRTLTDQITKTATCLIRSVDEKLTYENVTDSVKNRMLNTPERRARAYKFQGLFVGGPLDERPVEEACGYDPATLPN
jgi:hypothetical protein